MKMKIKRVVDHGTLESERVELYSVENCQLHFYQVADTTYTNEGKISNKVRHVHWFLDAAINEGDEVWLYTKVGTNSTQSINGGKNTRYIHYWNLAQSVWNNSGDGAILFELEGWSTSKVNK
ncbi:MAG: hypothetical protein JNM21_14900 [Taibaiella sp.]|nr:hypothetical protein [Taibaiella sp.]